MRLNAQTVALLVGAFTTAVGGAEMRFAVARVEDNLKEVERRMQRIENRIERTELAHVEGDHGEP